MVSKRAMRLSDILDYSKYRNYETLIDRDELIHQLSEIKRYFIDSIDVSRINAIFKHAKNTDQFIDGLEVYAMLSGIEFGLFLFDPIEMKIAAFAGFEQAPHLRADLWQAKNAQVFPPYGGKGLVGKIYKFCKENLRMSIQSDMVQSQSGEKLWTKTLPKLGIFPKILDLDTNRIHDNDGIIDVYDEKKNYCWIVEYDDHYRNQLTENSILIPTTPYVDMKTTSYRSSIY